MRFGPLVLRGLAAVTLAAMPAASMAQNTAPLFAWTQHGGKTGAFVRAIMPNATCPTLTHDGQTTAMTLRSAAPPPGFDGIYVCELAIAQTTKTLALAGNSLPAPAATLDKVAVLGDTGCRVKGGDVQNCTGNGSGPAWDYAGIAGAVAATSPDLVIHVGDMHYREYTSYCGLNCDTGNIGYTWDSWKADFFEPSGGLMLTSPWIMVRGNHEDCSRAWKGWFYFLDPTPISTSSWPHGCPAGQGGQKSWYYSDPYAVEIDSTRIIVMDSSYIEDDYHTPDPHTVKQYASEFNAVEMMAGQDGMAAWLVTHRPFWAVASYGGSSAGTTDATLQAALKASTGKALPKQVRMVMAGHIHLLESLAFGDGRPHQMVFGNGGTKRDPALGDNGQLHRNALTALGRLGVKPADFIWSDIFDFGLITPSKTGWSIEIKAKDGSRIGGMIQISK